MNPMSTSNGQVDQIIGSAYQLIKYVAANMETLITLAESIDPLVNSMQTAFEALKRTYAEAGYELLKASFKTGAAIGTRNHVLIDDTTGIAYSWGGALPHLVPQNSSPESDGGIGEFAWTARDLSSLRSELSGPNGVSLVGGAASISSLSSVAVHTFETARRSYKEAGFNLVPGSFEKGGELINQSDVLLFEGDGKAYASNELPKTVSPASSPIGNSNWISMSDRLLSTELASADGVNLIGGAGVYVYVANGVDDSAGLLTANARAVSGDAQLRIIGVAKALSSVTLSAQLYDSLNQIFTIDSVVNISNSKTKVRPEMFGHVEGALDKCVQVLPVFGGNIYLEEARYKTNRYQYGFSEAGKYIGKDNISIIGKKMPDGNHSLTQLENGSIIEGGLLVWANNPTLSDLGVDCGKSVVDASYGGVASPGITEGLIMTFPNDAVKNSGATKKGARLHNVCGLTYSPTALVHSVIIAEGYVDTVCTGTIHGMMGYHGVVIKAARVTADRILAECNGGEGMVIKSDDQLSATSIYVKINYLRTSRKGIDRSPHTAPPTAGTVGLMLHSTGVNGIDQVMIDTFVSDGHAFGIKPVKTILSDIINIEFGVANIDLLTATGSTLGLYYPDAGLATLLQMHFNELHVRNGQQAISLGTSKNRISVGHLDTKGLTDCMVDMQGESVVIVNTVNYKDFSGSGKWRINGGGVLKVGTTTPFGSEVAEFASGGAQVHLNADHTDQVQRLSARLINYGLELNGLIKSPDVSACVTLPAGFRPWAIVRSATAVKNLGSPSSTGTLTIGVDGSVTINEGGTAPTEWGSIATHFVFK